MKILSLVARLADAANRATASRDLAHFLHAEDFIFFVRDKELHIYLPGLGFPQTLHEGRRWMEFLNRKESRIYRSVLPYPSVQHTVSVVAIHTDHDAVGVLIGGEPSEDDILQLQQILPLLSALLQQEHGALTTKSVVKTAIDSVKKAERLNTSLDKARQNLMEAWKQNDALVKALKLSESTYKSVLEGIPQLVWTATPEGKFNYFNKNWVEYTGKHILNWEYVIHPSEWMEVARAWEISLQTGQVFEKECRLQDKHGAFRWFLIRAWPVKDEVGNIIKWHGSCTDVHEQIMQTSQLLAKNKELLRINSDLDNFIYTASHDLKAPILNIEGLVAVLQKNFSSAYPDSTDRIFQMMKTSVRRFKETIRDLLDISKIQRNIQEDVQLVSIHDIVEDVKFENSRLFSSAEVSIDINDQAGAIRFSRFNLKSMLYNLISNAIKYSSPERNPHIRILCSKQDKMIQLRVSDNGLGIETEYLDKIFSMFKRFHTHVEGTGIGLYIVKRIVENHEGRISVKSQPGEGTTFHLEFMEIA